MKMLYNVIKYVEDTKAWKLDFSPTKEMKWTMRGYSNSDFAGDQDTRRSVSGFVIYLNNAPINWRSKSQRSVTLSSTEAEYVAVSELSMEILFAAKTVEFLGMEVNYPIKVFVNNIGAIFFIKNSEDKQLD